MSNKSIYSLISAAALAGGLCFAGPVFADSCDGTNANPGPCDEVETNNIMAAATLLGTLSTTLSVNGAILDDVDTNPEDVDFFSFALLTSSLVQLTTTPLTGEALGDGILTLFDILGIELASNDDGGPFGTDPSLACPGCVNQGYSQIPFMLLGPGTYFAKIEGKVNELTDPDSGPTGIFIHDQPAYNLLIEREPIRGDGEPVPEPASLVLVGSGLAGLALWRRKRA